VNLAALLALFHVGGAFLFIAGYVATNVLTELARRSTDEPTLRAALGFSGWFDRRLLIPFATLAALAGLALVPARGYAWTSPWIVVSTLLYLAVMLVGIFVWGPRGGRIEAALTAGRIVDVRTFLAEPRFVLLSRAENATVALIVTLMILRPG
jgi:uncharacterized membrane protein